MPNASHNALDRAIAHGRHSRPPEDEGGEARPHGRWLVRAGVGMALLVAALFAWATLRPDRMAGPTQGPTTDPGITVEAPIEPLVDREGAGDTDGSGPTDAHPEAPYD